ncbi:MAG: hypothetical protein WAZ14_01765 [Patescibacteria group bacterium]
MKVHIPIYRPILKHALDTAWIHRELWPIAAIAGLAGTGSVINDVLNQAKLVSSIPDSSFNQIFGNLHVLGVYRDNLLSASAGQITVATLGILGLSLVLAVTIASCQQLMLGVAHAALKSKKHLTLRDLASEFKPKKVLRFLQLDLILKLLVANITIGTTLLVASLNVGHVISDAVFGVIFTSFAIALALTINILIMVALVSVTKHNSTMSEALFSAWKLLRRYPAVCLEMTAVLFAVNFTMSAAYSGVILLLGVPAVLGFTAALNTGSLLLYLLVLTASILIAVTVTLAFAGFTTTFTYSAWTALVEQLSKKSITPRSVVHTKRLLGAIK